MDPLLSSQHLGSVSLFICFKLHCVQMIEIGVWKCWANCKKLSQRNSALKTSSSASPGSLAPGCFPSAFKQAQVSQVLKTKLSSQPEMPSPLSFQVFLSLSCRPLKQWSPLAVSTSSFLNTWPSGWSFLHTHTLTRAVSTFHLTQTRVIHDLQPFSLWISASFNTSDDSHLLESQYYHGFQKSVLSQYSHLSK